MSICSRIVAASALLAAVITPSLASADTTSFGSQGQIILSAERMFGFSVASEKTNAKDNDSASHTDTVNSLSLLGTSSPGASFNPYLAPNFGVHFTVIPALTIGGNLGFARVSSDSEDKGPGGTTTRDGKPGNLFLVSPKVGYILNLAPNFSVWLRAGLTYYHASSGDTDDTGGENTQSGLGLNIDPMLVFSPIDHVGITLGPVIDLGLTGSSKNEKTTGSTTVTTESDDKYRNFGVTMGLLTHF